MNISKISPSIYTLKNRPNDNYKTQPQPYVADSVSFSGGLTGVMDSTENWIARRLVGLIHTSPMEKLIKATGSFQGKQKMLNEKIKLMNEKIAEINKTIPNKKDKIKSIKEHTDYLYSHLIVLGSTLLSGFYVVKTLKNKSMDEDKRKTLAVNQGLVWAASTTMAYTFDKWIGKKAAKRIDDFQRINTEANTSRIKNLINIIKGVIPNEQLEASFKKSIDKETKKELLSIDVEELKVLKKTVEKSLNGEKFNEFKKIAQTILTEADFKKLTNGAGKAKSIMTIDTVYRFIAPVLVTPIANAIGNRINENKQAKK